jgi:hypothetical protein
MSQLTFATTAHTPDFHYQVAQVRYQVSRGAFIECIEARCGELEARSTGVWAGYCPPDVAAEDRRAVRALRHRAELVLQSQALTVPGSYDLAMAPDLLGILLIHEAGSLMNVISGAPILTLRIRAHSEPTGSCTAQYTEYVLPDGQVFWRLLRSFSMGLPRGSDEGAV